MPFDDDRDPKKTPARSKVGLKIKNEDSIFANQPKKPTQQNLNDAVRSAQSKNTDYKDRAAELAPTFVKMLNDKTLLENKSIFSNEVEREIIGKLTQLAIDINNDEFEEAEGMGSVGIITLLLRCLFIQRDKINGLDYKLSLLEKKLPQSGDLEKSSK